MVGFGHRVTVSNRIPSYNIQALPPQYRGRWLFEEESAGNAGAPCFGAKHESWFKAETRARAPDGWRRSMLCAHSLLGMLTWSIRSPLPCRWRSRPGLWRDGFGVPYCLGVQDLFPQSVIDLGFMRNRMVVRFFEAMERFAYKKAGAVTVHSTGKSRAHHIGRAAIPRGSAWCQIGWIQHSSGPVTG